MTSLRILVAWLFLMLVACTSVDREPPRDGRFRELPPSQQIGEIYPDARQHRREPWEVWALHQDLRGRAIENTAVLRGDEYLRNRQLQRALQEYQSALQASLPPSEQEALVLRLASTQLALDNAQQSLRTMTEFFRSTGRIEEQVDDRFSIVFGYAYGRLENYHQSLAWFSRAHRTGAGNPGIRSATDSGVRALLRSMDDASFMELAEQWKNDLFISQKIGEERYSRTQSGQQTSHDSGGRFWELDRGMQITTPGSLTVPSEGKVLVAALLPLSGRYAQLGKSTMEGLQLAAMSYPELVQLDVRDTAGERARGTAELRSILASGSASLIVGPLISEVADDFIPLVKASRTPMLALSKRSYFPTGDGIFRLGPTIESQMDSLVDVAYYSLARRRFGVVSANTEAGRYHADVYRAKLRSLGITPEFERTYDPGDDTAIAEIASELESVNVDAIFVPDTVTVAARLFANISRPTRERIRLMGLANWNNPTLLAQSRGALGRAIFVSPFFLESERPVVKRFIEAYKNSFGSEPDFLAAQGFDAATVAFSGFRVEQEGRARFSEALLDIEQYEGLTGTIKVLPSGEIQRRLSVVELFGSDLREVPFKGPQRQVDAPSTPLYRGDPTGYFQSSGQPAPVVEYP